MTIDNVDIDIIMRQTGIKDRSLVRKTFYHNKKDVSGTICELLSLKVEDDKNKQYDTTSDDIKKIRSIVAEKEALFQQIKKDRSSS